MKICVSAGKDTLKSDIDTRFGRCQYFLFIDSETNEVTSVKNDGLGAHGAGVQAAQRVIDGGAEVVISGNIGPNAFSALNAAGIKTAKSSGNIEEAVADLISGKLAYFSEPGNKGH